MVTADKNNVPALLGMANALLLQKETQNARNQLKCAARRRRSRGPH